MSEDELATIEARTRHHRIDVALPRCTHDEERGHAPWCHDCDRERQERIGPTFETHGRGDVVALVAEVRRLAAERDAAFTRGVEAMREAAAMHFARRSEGIEHAAARIACIAPTAAVCATLDEARRVADVAAEIRSLRVAP